jgi:Ca-activated chloride channel family protein
MEKTKVKVDKWVDYKELYSLFLIPGLLFYLACLGLGNTRLVELP